MNIYEKLTLLQAELKAPKSQYNSYGGFKYRSLEDVVEGIKPLLVNYKLTLIMSDNVKHVGDRFYIETTVTLINGENIEEKIIISAVAREAASKKSFDESQITGATSSYARKYALNGLFCIDDNKDDDFQPQNNQPAVTKSNKTKYNGKNGSSNENNINSSVQHQPQIQGITKSQLEWLQSYCQSKGYNDDNKKGLMKNYQFNPKTTTASEFEKIKQKIQADDVEMPAIPA